MSKSKLWDAATFRADGRLPDQKLAKKKKKEKERVMIVLLFVVADPLAPPPPPLPVQQIIAWPRIVVVRRIKYDEAIRAAMK